MKKTSLLILLIIFTISLFAQTQFEGKVTHTFKTEKESESGTIEVFYGRQKIKGIKKIKGRENENGSDDLVIDFSKGILYKINVLTKTYTADTIANKTSIAFGALVKLPGKSKTILNHSCSAFTITDNGKNEVMGGMDFLFWYADSLYFTVDEKYLQSDEAALFTNGKTIGMGISVTIASGNTKTVFELTPSLIEPMHLPDSLFDIPKEYVLEESNDQYLKSDSIVEVEMSRIDSAIHPPKPPQVVKKKIPVKSTPKKVPAKSAATKRKE